VYYIDQFNDHTDTSRNTVCTEFKSQLKRLHKRTHTVQSTDHVHFCFISSSRALDMSSTTSKGSVTHRCWR